MIIYNWKILSVAKGFQNQVLKRVFAGRCLKLLMLGKYAISQEAYIASVALFKEEVGLKKASINYREVFKIYCVTQGSRVGLGRKCQGIPAFG